MVHLLARHPSTTPIILVRLDDCLRIVKGAEQYDAAKAIIFEAECVKTYFLTNAGDMYRECELMRFASELIV